MSVTVHLSGYLKPFSGGETEVRLENEFLTVGDVLETLFERHRALRDRVLTEQGDIRKHVNIFVGSDDVKRLKGLLTPIKGDELHIFNAVSGG
jgi:molybdopterin converting factor small subunit